MSNTPTMQTATLNRLGPSLLVMAGCWLVVQAFPASHPVFGSHRDKKRT